MSYRTYKRVELFPGPSLNLIIGPNGTGKSTFMCAIILGLCGKPSVIGRSKKVSVTYWPLVLVPCNGWVLFVLQNHCLTITKQLSLHLVHKRTNLKLPSSITNLCNIGLASLSPIHVTEDRQKFWVCWWLWMMWQLPHRAAT